MNNEKLDELSDKTLVDKEELLECPDCGESVFNDFFISEVNANVVTVECHNCGEIQDIWAKQFRPSRED